MCGDASSQRYQLAVRPAAAREIRKLPSDTAKRINVVIRALAADPFPVGAIKLTNEDGLYRVRVGDYRIIYQRDDPARVVTIVRVRHRRESYR